MAYKPRYNRRLKLKGRKLNKLTILEHVGWRSGNSVWRCRCECGTVKDIMGFHIKAGTIKSCGCLGKPKHGLSKHPDYGVWANMIHRCYGAHYACYKGYGSRGVSVCARWRFGEDGKHPFLCWLEDVGPRPKGLMLDRINFNGHYTPENSRWVTPAQSARNKRRQGVTPRMLLPLKEKTPRVRIPPPETPDMGTKRDAAMPVTYRTFIEGEGVVTIQ
jgi:hypothetical protein